jgi:hypothetical protein
VDVGYLTEDIWAGAVRGEYPSCDGVTRDATV